MNTKLISEEVNNYINKFGKPKWLDILFTDVSGILRHKLVSASKLEFILHGDIPLPVSISMMTTEGSVSHTLMDTVMKGDPDQNNVYIENSLKPVPIKNKSLQNNKLNTNRCQIQITNKDYNSTTSYDPRCQLHHAIINLKKYGIYTKIALEYEFMLSNIINSNAQQNNVASNKAVEYMSDNSFDKYRLFIDKLLFYAGCQDLNITGIVKEYGCGQFEINMDHGDPLKICDEAMQIKRLVKLAAKEFDLIASFMAKPKNGSSGNGMHAHISYYYNNNKNNIFHDQKGKIEFYKIIAGILALIPESIALIAPNENSYRRFVHSQFAPIYCNWGENHRGVAIRIPNSNLENKRIEYRLAGADACPYLLVATILASSLYGLNNTHKLTMKISEGKNINKEKTFPRRWHEALDKFNKASQITSVMNKEFLKAYFILKNEEEQSLHEQISVNEYNRLISIV